MFDDNDTRIFRMSSFDSCASGAAAGSADELACGWSGFIVGKESRYFFSSAFFIASSASLISRSKISSCSASGISSQSTKHFSRSSWT